jgi:MFS family permease
MTSRAKYDSIATSGVDDGGTISPPPRSPANLAALRLNLLCYSMTNLSPAAIFPFFAIVMAEKTPSKIMVGVIYASQPAMAFLVAPLVPRLTAKFGRIPVTCFGLVVAAAGCAGFGASSSVANWLLFHALEGVGNALIDVPASALLLAHSADIAEVSFGAYFLCLFMHMCEKILTIVFFFKFKRTWAC